MFVKKVINCALLSALLLVSCLGVFFNVVNANPGKNIFSKPSENLKGEAKLNFSVGRGLFRRLWVTAPASTQAADGLGPLYNARSCMACHPDNARGRSFSDDEHDTGQLLLRIDVPPQNDFQQQQLVDNYLNNIPEPTYGIQLQSFAIANHSAESKLGVSYKNISVKLQDGKVVNLRKPSYKIYNLAYGGLHQDARTSLRVPPQMIGLGLLEAINEDDIFRQEDPHDKDADGISGRANIVWSNEISATTLGRFGYKSGIPSINEQVQSAFSIDLGLSVPLFDRPSGDCTDKQVNCLHAPNGNSVQYDDLEANQQVVDLVNLYVKNIAVPRRRNTDDPDVILGEKLFNNIGCQKCHTSQYKIDGVTDKQKKTISPYTDLLLHDMGEALADNRPEGKASGKEWRTAPLWGISLTNQVVGYNHFLHDGRARTLIEAILWHGGEAQSQRDAVVKLDQVSREQLILFLESL